MTEFISDADQAVHDSLLANGFRRVAIESAGEGVREYTYFNKGKVMVKINYAFSTARPEVETAKSKSEGLFS